MIISRGRGYIFVHIPKTGGTAMAVALERRAMADDILIGDTPKARRRKGRLVALRPAGRLWKHSTVADIAGIVTADELSRMLVFTLVRNPWDRMVSYWTWLRLQEFAHPAVVRAKGASFAQFVADPATRAEIAAWPYGRYVDGSGALFLRLEHLEEDQVPLVKHLGFRPDLPRVNETRRQRDWRGYYDDTTAGIVGETCAADIDRFGYGFDDCSP